MGIQFVGTPGREAFERKSPLAALFGAGARNIRQATQDRKQDELLQQKQRDQIFEQSKAIMQFASTVDKAKGDALIESFTSSPMFQKYIEGGGINLFTGGRAAGSLAERGDVEVDIFQRKTDITAAATMEINKAKAEAAKLDQ